MRKLLLSITSAIAIAVSGISLSFAQDDGPPNFVPVEMQVCNYNDGKNAGDFDDAMDKMLQWMEENDGAPYAAWKINKWYAGGTQDWDFLYLGAWPDGSTMGRDNQQYGATGEDAIEAFLDVADCPASLMFASLQAKAPAESDGQGDGFVLNISNCNVADGRDTWDAIAAMEAFAAYRDANGSPGGTYLWFPVLGGGEEDFDFKLVNSFASIEAYGDYFQWTVENAAYAKSGELTDGLVDCDVPRGYVGDTIVNTMTGN